MVPELYAEPANENELARVLEYANRDGTMVTPSRRRHKAGLGLAPQTVDLKISTAKYNGTGARTGGHDGHGWGRHNIYVLQNALSAHRQRLALDPLWPERATVGGVIAANDSGALRLRYGGVRDLIIGITVVLPRRHHR